MAMLMDALERKSGGALSNPISHLVDASEDEDLSSLRKDRTGIDNTIWVSPISSH
jgi:hypothetical protein